MVTLKPKNKDGAIIEVWESKRYTYSEWHFAITHNGIRRRFPTIPNICDSKHAAICRARIRAKWLDNGTWDEHYGVNSSMNKPINTYNRLMKKILENDIKDGLHSLELKTPQR